ncbi:MFS transporter [Stigmatella aurantiaca]|uniref:Major facilitator superfamily n=1 Tax=Stigmatella aurantiaca (strain DW4/3-1) TaxID=378806 RepID=Q08VI5_STIAD|nr:MFS transporter [Stigmatella aurantiaca]ADO70601.1 Major facilitator superfamily MFS-1 protein [Stigmatella aurantiaca DW4/3-1]EAU64513.1 major facilitator superfamily [Stigmatella aurantiaca DW4/3-1]
MTLSSPALPAPVALEPRSARIAISAIFFINGFAFASWVPHIPTVQTRLGLSTAVLGLALLGVALGALVAMPITGMLVARWGSRAVTLASSLLFCPLVALPVRAPSLPLLVVALVCFGAANGAMDVAMNAHAVAVERQLGKTVMSSFHALFSLGGLTGAGSSILLLSWGLTPSMHMTGAALLGLGVVLGASRFLLPASADEGGSAHSFALPRGPLLLMGFVTFLVLMVEGAMADWSAVYLRQSLGTEVGLAGAGYAVFSLAMTAGRLTGDRLVSGLGPEKLLRSGALLATGGLGAALLLHHPVAALIGFGCVGLGLSNLIPVLFSAAGRTPGVPSGVGIAAVSTTGYGGFLVGPPLIGLLAGPMGLPASLGLLVAFLALVAASGSRVLGAQA